MLGEEETCEPGALKRTVNGETDFAACENPTKHQQVLVETLSKTRDGGSVSGRTQESPAVESPPPARWNRGSWPPQPMPGDKSVLFQNQFETSEMRTTPLLGIN